MKLTDFYIGLEFLGPAGFCWRCTDVGTRTIAAIRLEHEDPAWYRGPPYVVKEEIFDEREIERCHLTEEEAILASIEEADTSGHPGYPDEVANKMMRARLEESGTRYPHRGVLRFDRLAVDGELLHPYAARGDSERWIVLLYLPFQQAFDEMPELDFIALPTATAADVRARADRPSAAGSANTQLI
ncbi:hypothetical protein [Burkholderia gladioli]|uniref:hypothetical protein n=1 Tax=Burkholderia gladioli TaxID=28095 RepID=UPI0005A72965|nr:hypothetical protein [Burkholderia gladioli]AWY52970.1 hypothetical protein A8H28_16845 [Burkholderia gladioli pv. gladioli]